MKLSKRWGMGLTVLLAVLLQQPLAWGQLRVRSGASKSGLEHPKALEQRIFQLTNEARRQHGLNPLDPDQTLMNLARAKSDDMIKRHYFSHTDPDGKSIRERYLEEVGKSGGMAGLGENICINTKSDYTDTETAARMIVDGFMVSPGHRSNILQPAWTSLGIGVSLKGKEQYVTQSFGQGINKRP